MLTDAVDVSSVGGYAGGETVQVYVGFPDDAEQPPKVLRGFGDVELWPSETGTVTVTLRRKDVSWWSVGRQRWVLGGR